MVSGIAAGYVTHELGPGVPRPRRGAACCSAIGTPLGEIGSWALIACSVVLAARPAGPPAVPAAARLLLVPGAWLVHLDHIFSPKGVAGMVLLGVGTAALALVGDRRKSAERSNPDPGVIA